MVEHQREVEQSVARRAHNPKVEGSNPSLATIFYAYDESGPFSRICCDKT